MSQHVDSRREGPHRSLTALRHRLPRGNSLADDVWRRRHRGVLILLFAHVPVIFAVGLWRGVGPRHAALEAGVIALFGIGSIALRHARRETTIFAALGLLTCSAVLVHLMGGLIEMHFHFFVMVAVITLYQDWWSYLTAIAYVVLQHGVAGALAPETVYDHQAAVDNPWRWAGIHAAFIIAISIAGVISWKLNERLLAATVEREEMLAEAQRVARLANWEIDLTSGAATCSDEMYRLLGVDAATFVPSRQRLVEQIHPDDRDEVNAELDRIDGGRTSYVHDLRVVVGDGTTRWLQVIARRARADRPGHPPVLVGTVQDVTDRKQADTELRETLSLLSATLDATADGILVVDRNGMISSYNERFADLWQIPSEIIEELDDDAMVRFVMSQLVDPEGFAAKVRGLYAAPDVESHDFIAFKDGRYFERNSRPQRVGGSIVGRVWSFRDITDRKRLEDELAHQAFHDSLTNLPNQRLFRDRVDHALRRATRQRARLAVLFVDLDNFKTVNDSLGHNAGDELLVRVTDRIVSSLRSGDSAARLGGDEFAVLLESLDNERSAAEVADRLITRVREPIDLGGTEVVIGASIGIAHESPGIGVDQLLRNADLAMYSAKALGRGRSQVFEPRMHEAAVERLAVEADLRRACERNELVVHYQPIVDVATGRIRALEALVRWQHPTRGLLPPVAFVPLAEECGLIPEIGRLVLASACTQVRRWQVDFDRPALSIAVNLSPRHLADPQLVHDVASILCDARLDPALLTLEVTEGSMMQDTEFAVARLVELKALGVKLAIDDFGTGYSSLSHLQRFPIDIVKIDRSFVGRIDDASEESALTNVIVGLAQTLHLDAVAEGVETEGQLERLRELGCQLAQGFLMAEPADATTITALLRAEPTLAS